MNHKWMLQLVASVYKGQPFHNSCMLSTLWGHKLGWFSKDFMMIIFLTIVQGVTISL